MADIFSSNKRSEIMSKVSGRDTKPEMIVRRYLFAHGFRYRKNVKKLPGTPDIVLSKYKTVIFVHGCYWHGHEYRAGKLPTTNVEFWTSKIETNIARDAKVISALESLRWRVIIVWQCELKNQTLKAARLFELRQQILSDYI